MRTWSILLLLLTVAEPTRADSTEKLTPNVVLFFADDLGYADLNCFGGQQMSTPNLDQLAAAGMRLTSFYSSQAVCSASRCSLLTGCYNVRVGILGALGPKAKVCLNPAEMTIAELLKPAGYATAIFGKWHLGDSGIGLPLNHGFDQYHGLPYSNDMWPRHPTNKSFPPLPLYKNGQKQLTEVTAEDQTQLTRWATEHALSFIETNRDRPFLLYLPYSMPHVPLFVSEQFRDQTGNGLYADVIAEIDWSVGQVMAKLKQYQLDTNTLVLFTSDNGPWLSYGDHAGSAGPLREGKGTTWEGGVRVPAIAHWPGKIPANTVCEEVAGTIDVLPTLAEISGAKLPELQIDGKSIWPLLSGEPRATSPHEAYYFYWDRELQAVRSGPWKLHFPHGYRSLENKGGSGGNPANYVQKKCGLELYNLQEDVGEQNDCAAAHPEIVQRLTALAESMRAQLGDKLTERVATTARPPGKL
jgi:arylsulfatase A